MNHGDSFCLLPWYSVPHPRLEGVGEREGDVAEAAQRTIVLEHGRLVREEVNEGFIEGRKYI